LKASQSSAAALAKEVQGGIPNLVAAANSQSLPGAIHSLTLPAGVSVTENCTAIGGTAGSITLNSNITSSTIVAGDTIDISYNGCTLVSGGETIVENGNATIVYTSYVSATDFSFTVTYSNLSVSATGTYNYTFGPASGSWTYTDNNGVYSVVSNLSNGGVTNIGSTSITTGGSDVTISSATYVYNSSAAGGVVTVSINNWTYDTSTGLPVSGTIIVTGANGDKVTITASATGYTVVYDIGGTLSSFTVSYA
jgi:hypothetical protein